MQRYDDDGVPDDDGDWVLYDDHAEYVAELEREVAELQRRLNTTFFDQE